MDTCPGRPEQHLASRPTAEGQSSDHPKGDNPLQTAQAGPTEVWYRYNSEHTRATEEESLHTGCPGGAMNTRAWHREAVELAAITAFAAALRFARLGEQSFWVDELVTSDFMGLGLRELLLAIRSNESTPPLYYVVAWVWSKATGPDEVGLRSLSALMGTATVPVAYFAARTLADRRAAALAAVFVALSPMLVWYSQEARSYALLILLSGLSFLFFARALVHDRTIDFVAWGAASAAALTSHYFAGFLVFIEAAWLIHQTSSRRRLALGLAPVVMVGVGLLPLLEWQRSENRTSWIAEMPAEFRVRQLGTWFATGHLRASAPLVVVAAIAIIGIWLLLRRTDGAQRAGGLTALGVGLGTIVLAGAVSVAGLDHFLFRNLAHAWMPLAIAIAVGLASPAAGRLGTAAAAVLCAVFAFADASTSVRPGLQRDDWRSVVSKVTSTAGPAAFVVHPVWGARPLLHYARDVQCLECIPGARTKSGGHLAGRYDPSVPIRVREIWLIAVHGPFDSNYTGWTPPLEVSFTAPSGFREVTTSIFQNFVLRRYVARRTRPVRFAELRDSIAASGPGEGDTPARVLLPRNAWTWREGRIP